MHVDLLQVTEFGPVHELTVFFQGQMTVLAGPPACGLTTRLRALACALSPWAARCLSRINVDVTARLAGGGPSRRVWNRDNDRIAWPVTCQSYGVARPIRGSSGRRTSDAHETGLFEGMFGSNDGNGLFNTELYLRRLGDGPGWLGACDRLGRLAGLTSGSVAVGNVLSVDGVSALFAPHSTISLLAMGADIMHEVGRLEPGHGLVVLIDEVELRLHPQQQEGLLQRFVDVFPGVQFVVSTKSPVVVGEAARMGSLLELGRDRKSVV